MEDPVCPVCLHDFTEATSVGKLRRCKVCTHLFQWPLKVTADYGYEYVHERYEAYPTTDAMSHMRVGFLRAIHPGGGRLLDVGYGNGSFLKVAQKAGYDAFGNDVHGCGHRFGVRDVELNGDKWDVVTFFDSLEHFTSLALPREVCRNASTVIVSVPCMPKQECEISTWKHYRPGEHLHYFTEKSLDIFMTGKRRVACLDLEDTIRGDRNGEWNILTAAWKAKDEGNQTG